MQKIILTYKEYNKFDDCRNYIEFIKHELANNNEFSASEINLDFIAEIFSMIESKVKF